MNNLPPFYTPGELRITPKDVDYIIIRDGLNFCWHRIRGHDGGWLVVNTEWRGSIDIETRGDRLYYD